MKEAHKKGSSTSDDETNYETETETLGPESSAPPAAATMATPTSRFRCPRCGYEYDGSSDSTTNVHANSQKSPSPPPSLLSKPKLKPKKKVFVDQEGAESHAHAQEHNAAQAHHAEGAEAEDCLSVETFVGESGQVMIVSFTCVCGRKNRVFIHGGEVSFGVKNV
ncbi:hypothetical protein TorRG33x02_093940 [Trema orientale]|uniref:Uncharacterized protein n=1 Tax=Trema orientale TaxID=63057 RepID=A0A2P5FAR9_TREOI|nr:hypothetical protein TorRG33x02_093940 [Trema orientale]